MGLVIAVAGSFVLWIVMWSLGVKAFDGIWIVFGILIIAVTARSLARYLPGRG